VPIAEWETERESPWKPAKQQAGGHETDHSTNPVTTPESSPARACAAVEAGFGRPPVQQFAGGLNMLNNLLARA
jgi:hypothetical protein